MNECSIGLQLNEDCHRTTYGKVVKYNNEEISDDLKYVLSKRCEIEESKLSDICSYHKQRYIQYFSERQRSCTNPLNIHKKPITKGHLFTITSEFARLHNLVPGKKLCYRCKDTISGKPDTVEVDADATDPDYLDISKKSTEDINQEILDISLSPIKDTKLSKDQIKRKVIDKAEKTKAKVLKIVDAEDHDPNVAICEQNNSRASNHLDAIMQAAKKKFQLERSYNEKVSLLTLAPDYWSIAKTVDFFETTEYMVQQARKLRSDKCILAERQTKVGTYSLSEEVKETVKSFYEAPENSRIMPGKKDTIIIKTENGRITKQKQLLLCILKELYNLFKQNNPNIKIGFSHLL